MKKSIVAMAVLVAASGGVLAAEYGDITVGSIKNQVTEQRSTLGIVTYGQQLGNLDVEGRVGVARSNDTNTNDNMIEGRARYNFNSSSNFKPWIRGTIGEQLNSGSNHYAYWAVEPGMGYTVTPALRVDVSVARSEAFDNSVVGANVNTGTVGLTYNCDKKNSVSGRFIKSTNDVRADRFEVGYTRNF
jgi:predicted porin